MFQSRTARLHRSRRLRNHSEGRHASDHEPGPRGTATRVRTAARHGQGRPRGNGGAVAITGQWRSREESAVRNHHRSHRAGRVPPSVRRKTLVSRTGSGAPMLPQRGRRQCARGCAAGCREVVSVQGQPLCCGRPTGTHTHPATDGPNSSGPHSSFVLLRIEPWLRQASELGTAMQTLDQRPLARTGSVAVRDRIVETMARPSPGTDRGMAG